MLVYEILDVAYRGYIDSAPFVSWEVRRPDCPCVSSAGWWTSVAKEGFTIYMRGKPVYFDLPADLIERMLDFVLHVLSHLAQLIEGAGTEPALPR